ncbi:radical SAM family heme chaperone HemW [Lacticaseibacillus nasuensis]|uniref:radical SAM family heme chaperone HemW n=1 Tax=Lacticaseibacillus nasuensis TaxID=944671 RepID=UPI00224714C7|nr:radical SAM family heme chaperone HemW [Lacticaseibacillus nasuensis]MCX2456139.1 radical SAM family heme chaperone HemW [Lacticaseibacillus nasuensis]
MAGAYVHIPFCSHICYYCDFNKVFIDGQPVDEYVDRLIQEMHMVMAAHPGELIETVYIGGGTPTALTAAQLDRLCQGIRRELNFTSGEFTVEANPNDLLGTDKLAALKANGVTRLSIGVQSFDDEILKRIGRTHTVADVLAAIKNARAAGFDNLSIDLIFRLPGQSRDKFLDSLHQALALDLPHYSTYSLILERKTVFYNMMRQGRLHLPSQDVEADMYQDAIDLMAANGRQQYEISNFAVPGYECRHNLLYWQNAHYFGFGAGAFGYIGRDRYHNFGPIQQYLQPLREGHVPVIEHHLVPLTEQMEEELFLGLRTNAGVSRQRFKKRYALTLDQVYGPVVRQLVARGLLADDGEHLTLTEQGKQLGNEVFEEFLITEPLVD